MAAVVTALSLAGVDSRRRRREAEGRSMWIAVAIHPPLFAWAREIKQLKRALGEKRFSAAVYMIEGRDSRRPVLKPPDGFLDLRKDVPELGEAAGPLGQACFLLSEVAGKWDWINSALRGEFDGEEAQGRAMKLLHGNIETAETMLWQSERLIKRQVLRQRSVIRVYARVAVRSFLRRR